MKQQAEEYRSRAFIVLDLASFKNLTIMMEWKFDLSLIFLHLLPTFLSFTALASDGLPLKTHHAGQIGPRRQS
jgi:hypothetical protein